MFYLDLFKEILRGKGLSRALTNLKLGEKNIIFSGTILDLGGRGLYFVDGKPRGGSYLRFLKFKEAKILRLDIDEKTKPDFKIDLEREKLPFEDNSINAVLAFNLLEHIFNYQFLIKEIFRVLKPEGVLLGSVPFLLRIHPDPKDFFRYTREALEKIFKESGFRKIEINFIGYGPFSNQYSQIEFILPRILRFFFAYLSIFLDKIILAIKPSLKEKFPLDFLFILEK